MKNEILDEVIACLPKERTLFHYFKGQYAFLLLSYAAKSYSNIAAIKRTNFQNLLNQRDIKMLLSHQGSGKVVPALFENAWKETSQAFVLSIDKWGAHDHWNYQTTRKGCNLVLQLNFQKNITEPTND